MKCSICSKKTIFQCRCDKFFCSKHRFPSTTSSYTENDHICTFDFKAEERKKLSKESVSYVKIIKI